MSISKAVRGLKYLDQVYYMMKPRPEIFPAYTGIEGLYHDDILHEDEVVAEAIRRLPLELQDERNFRLIRALQCDIKHIWLPDDQWTTYENDLRKGRYMQPYIEDIIKEVEQRDAWEAEH